ncbi:hypothetical protein PAHAL_5G467600 [Panicum hallii]|uniref:Uncharacterized protein n=1 Tax=Panicum hallii TaxID=206008 RepID=A0A2S3HXL6_9POAL|nr:hypothetical protein PAHAL_5G467600 [Panicum hallii]
MKKHPLRSTAGQVRRSRPAAARPTAVASAHQPTPSPARLFPVTGRRTRATDGRAGGSVDRRRPFASSKRLERSIGPVCRWRGHILVATRG